MLQIATAASLWGTWSLFLRPAKLAPTVTAPLVLLLVGVFAVPSARAEARAGGANGAAGAWRALLVLSAVLEAVNVVTFFGAMAVTTNAVAVLTHYFAPVLVALAAPYIDRTRVRGATLAALLAALGLALVLRPWNARADSTVLLGATLGTISAFAYAGNVFTLRRLVTVLGPARAQALRSVLAALLLAPALAFSPSALASVRVTGVLWVTVGAMLPGAFAGLLFAKGLPRAGAARASVLTYLEPLVSVAIGALVWGESTGPLAVVGCALVVLAGVIVSRGSAQSAG
jgi:drug/metabolite transporter (DMT)-like permease